MEPDDLGSSAALHWPEAELPDRITAAKTATAAADAPPGDAQGDVQDGMPSDAQAAVSALYRAHAVGLIRLAFLMLGDRAAAEDMVQDAFFGLYRRWDRLADPGGALPYVRSSVLNGCRTALRRRARSHQLTDYQPPTGSAEAAVLTQRNARK